MMRNMLNAMRQQSDMAGQSRASVRQGVVSAYDGRYSVKVRIMPEDRETGWLPVASPWIGNGWGLFAPPSVGDAVEVQFQEDDAEAGYVSGRFFNDSDQALKVPAGEFWLVHKTGAFLKFFNDGHIELNAAGNLVATVAGDADITATGNVNITAPTITLKGNIFLDGPVTQRNTAGGSTAAHMIGPLTVDNDVTAGAISLEGHKHTGVQSGNNTTGGPA